MLALSVGCSDEPEPIEIVADNIAWSPTEITVVERQKAVLHLRNEDQVAHLFRSEDLGLGFNAETMMEAKTSVSLTFTPEAAGTYEFWCKLHPKVMRGTIVAEEA